MRVNCHAHIFNAKSVFNKYTLEILFNRITDMGIPESLEKAVAKQLTEVFNEVGDFVDEKKFFENVLSHVADTEEYKDLLQKITPSLKVEFEIIGSEKIKEASAEFLTKLISKVYSEFDSHDVRKQDIMDFIDFLRISLQPSIRNVTDIIVRQLPNKTDAVVALMMDITSDGNDNGQFERQLKDTSAMVLAYPGRIFPFVAVNPMRPDHFQIMERALNGMGFVGVKLYPSLGFDIVSPELYKVYAYCEERQIPILMHCSKGGFKHSDQYANNSSPEHWNVILDRHNDLKICFGHFGGDHFFAGLAEPDNKPAWCPMILELMEQYPNVYGDISYHTAPMNGGDVESNYFTALNDHIENPKYKQRILWGTDFFLVRSRLREKSHWNYMKKMIYPDNYQQISAINPNQYLGLDPDNLSWVMTNYVKFVADNAQLVETAPPAWLKKAVRNVVGESVVFDATPLGRAWSLNNKAHVTLYEDFKKNEFLEPTPFEESGGIKLSAMAYWRDLRLGSANMAKMMLRQRSVKIIKSFKKAGAALTKKDEKRLKKDQAIIKCSSRL
jgi:predicted TIM-barrel fold metal-dependent hydrolase